MRLLSLALLLTLGGCFGTVPVVPKFPEAPKSFQEPCPQLLLVDKGVGLSEFTKTVVLNYSLYYQCASKNDGWTQWYIEQKKNYESVTK